MNLWPFGRESKEEKRQQEIINKLNLMAQTQTELAAQLHANALQAEKIAAEQQKRFDDVTAQLDALKAQIDSGAITSDLQAAAAELQTRLDALDATIPDAPATPTATATA